LEVARDKTIAVLNRKKAELKEEMDRKGYSKDLQKKFTLHHCTMEEVDKLIENKKKLEKSVEILTGTSLEKIWMDDLVELEGKIKKYVK